MGHAAAFPQSNCVPSVQRQCRMVASLRATATFAFFGPIRLMSLRPQLFSGEPRRTTLNSTLADLLVSGAQLRGRHHLLAGAGGSQRALCHQPAPGEEVVARDAMTPRDERDRVAGEIRLFDDPHLFLRRPAAPPLHRRDHLDALGAWRAFVETSHRVRHTTHTYPSARP